MLQNLSGYWDHKKCTQPTCRLTGCIYFDKIVEADKCGAHSVAWLDP